MSDIKDSWKQTGNSVGQAIRDLSKSLIITGKYGVEKAVEWAEKDDPEYVDTTAEPTPGTEDK